MITKSQLSRRTLLAGGVGTLALLAIAPQMSTASAPGPYDLAAWLPLLGTEVTADGGAVLRVRTVEDLRTPERPDAFDSNADRFRLVFTLVSGEMTSDSITVHHPQAGEVSLLTNQFQDTAVAYIDRRGASLLPLQN
ncbi:hypothetical protein NHF46_09705 [Arthrobacter alpinus]|uniref:Uncharacterized protein n=1 Tax=Arthrobacter alpinus TaxID=656366 RepID=A0A0S2M019_9MICC|nr:hypothetical protein [Arthrobacter alpinus]ALO67109.1 hypothetical protein AS189_12110 [Arthrobacter alpinus]MDD0857964.1 hypothetical protein [Arthrobacter alpinus]